MAVDLHQLDIAPAEAAAPAVRQRRGWLRRMYSPVGVPAEQGVDADDGGAARKPRRRGEWLRRLVVLPREHALRRRWKALSGAPSRLAAGLPRWKRASVVGGGGWAAELADAAAFRVMYVVEAVVLGLALSCFFCCCGCQI
ncbi:unnamed protein product [Urochloa decumbens]|uniref:Uncharacterized protein n=1 Tax=Urochloa decumbens TaxID=240449 RepID=A0ABC9ACH4_9POAL